MIHKTEQRNREIFAAHQQGEDVQALAERYNLSAKTVQQIILFEKYKQEVSAEPFYQAIRMALQAE
jgi:Mor family transcriptional regulator